MLSSSTPSWLTGQGGWALGMPPRVGWSASSLPHTLLRFLVGRHLSSRVRIRQWFSAPGSLATPALQFPVLERGKRPSSGRVPSSQKRKSFREWDEKGLSPSAPLPLLSKSKDHLSVCREQNDSCVCVCVYVVLRIEPLNPRVLYH